jgi:hypothetical protein
MPKQTDFLRTLTVDPALIQDRSYRFNPDDRQYIDNQIRDLQQFSLGLYRQANVLPTVTTVDATPVYVVLATLAAGDIREVDVLVTIKNVDASVHQSFKLSALVYGVAGPVATLGGGSLTDSAPRGTGTAVAELDLNGADIRLKITGIAATPLLITYDPSVV